MTIGELKDLERALAQLQQIQAISTVSDIRRRVDMAADILTWVIAGKPDTERAALMSVQEEMRS